MVRRIQLGAIVAKANFARSLGIIAKYATFLSMKTFLGLHEVTNACKMVFVICPLMTGKLVLMEAFVSHVAEVNFLLP